MPTCSAVGDEVRALKRILLSVAAISLSQISAYAQSVELAEVRV
jgi:hypothetical protein